MLLLYKNVFFSEAIKLNLWAIRYHHWRGNLSKLKSQFQNKINDTDWHSVESFNHFLVIMVVTSNIQRVSFEFYTEKIKTNDYQYKIYAQLQFVFFFHLKFNWKSHKTSKTSINCSVNMWEVYKNRHIFFTITH